MPEGKSDWPAQTHRRGVFGNAVHSQAQADVVKINITGFDNGPAQVDPPVSPLFPAMIIPIAERQGPRTVESRFRSNYFFLQPGDGGDDFIDRPGWILALGCPVLQRAHWVADDAFPVFHRTSPGEKIGVKIGLAG